MFREVDAGSPTRTCATQESSAARADSPAGIVALKSRFNRFGVGLRWYPLAASPWGRHEKCPNDAKKSQKKAPAGRRSRRVDSLWNHGLPADPSGGRPKSGMSHAQI